MGKIVAIGGGEIGRPGYSIETTEIDRRILELTGKSKPTVLFLPTASNDAPSYEQVFCEHFGSRLGCVTDTLKLIKKKPYNIQEMTDKVFNADAVYVGGGNTARMMRIWRSSGLDQVLREAYSRGIVLSGLSAGAICWFRYGNSDSRRALNPEADMIRVAGLGLISATICPHFDVEETRRPDLRSMMRRTPGIAIALDNCCAIEIVDGSYRILTSKAGASAYKVFWSAGALTEEIIDQNDDFTPLDELLSKQSAQ